MVLPNGSRVRRSADFAATLKGGRRARRGSVVVHVARRKSGTTEATDPAATKQLPRNRSSSPAASPRSDAPVAEARAGFIVSKAVGPAVVRNKVKRRLRHVIADRIQDWPPDMDVVVRALPEAAKADFTRLSSDVDAALAVASRRRR